MNSFFVHGYYFIPLAAHRVADLLEYFHDVRVVWPFEIQKLAALAGHSRELGNCFLRILFSGARQSLGQRHVLALPIEDHPGGDHAGGVRGVRLFLSRRKNPVELCRGVRMHPRGSGICFLAKELTAKDTKA